MYRDGTLHYAVASLLLTCSLAHLPVCCQLPVAAVARSSSECSSREWNGGKGEVRGTHYDEYVVERFVGRMSGARLRLSANVHTRVLTTLLTRALVIACRQEATPLTSTVARNVCSVPLVATTPSPPPRHMDT